MADPLFQVHVGVNDLSDEVLLYIFMNLAERDLCRLACVCSRWRSLSGDRLLWRSLYLQKYSTDNVMFGPGAPMCVPWKEKMKKVMLQPRTWRERFRELRFREFVVGNPCYDLYVFHTYEEIQPALSPTPPTSFVTSPAGPAFSSSPPSMHDVLSDGLHSYAVVSTAWWEDVIVSDMKNLNVVELSSGRIVGNLIGHRFSVTSVCGRGRLVFSGGDDNTIRCWDAVSLNSLGTLSGHTDGVHAMDLNNGQLVSAGNDRRLCVWDVDTMTQVIAIDGAHDSYITAVHACNSLIATASDDASLVLWDRRSCEPVARVGCHSNHVTAVALAADGALLASSSYDDTIRLWDVRQHQPISVCHNTIAFSFAMGAVYADWLMASGGRDGSVKLWDLERLRSDDTPLLCEYAEHDDWVMGISLEADGSLVTASWDTRIRVWRWEWPESEEALTTPAYQLKQHIGFGNGRQEEEKY